MLFDGITAYQDSQSAIHQIYAAILMCGASVSFGLAAIFKVLSDIRDNSQPKAPPEPTRLQPPPIDRAMLEIRQFEAERAKQALGK